uniref:Uncharacterized protein n=1 Tax=viral metagenome TaxID=1070528 RepID=A0A6H1Z6Q4_9ZZZZ
MTDKLPTEAIRKLIGWRGMLEAKATVNIGDLADRAEAELAAILKRNEEQETRIRVQGHKLDLLQREQMRMRDPERTLVCDIIANGALLPDETRYALPDEAVLETQIAVMREAIKNAVEEAEACEGPACISGTGLMDLQAALALTPDGKHVVDVAWLREIRAVLLEMLDETDSHGVYPKDSTVGDIIDKLAVLIGRMKMNEAIARWLGKDIHIGSTRDLCDGDLYRFGDAEGICIVHVTDDESHSFVGWNPEEYIEDWHGADGLLAEIERRGLSRPLHREWMSQRVAAEDQPFDRQMPYADEIAAAYLRATPAQLAAALVKVIEEEGA